MRAVQLLSENTAITDEQELSPLKEAYQTFFANKTAVVGLMIVIFFILIAIFAPLLAPYGINDQSLTAKHMLQRKRAAWVKPPVSTSDWKDS